MNRRTYTLGRALVTPLALVAATCAAAAYAQPVIVEPGWELTRTVSFNAPFAAHYNPVDGLIYVSRRDAWVLYRIESDGSATLVWPSGSGSYVAGIVCDPDDGYIFTSDDYNGWIWRTPVGQIVAPDFWVSGFHSGDDDPVGMAIAPSNYTGNVVQPGEALVVDRGWNGGEEGCDEVWGWSPDYAQGEWLVHGDDEYGFPPSPLVNAMDIAIGTSDVYLVDMGDEGGGPIPGIIYRLDGPTGGLTPVDTSPETLVDPLAIAIDPLTQDLLVFDSGGGVYDARLVRVRVSGEPPTGVVSVVLTGYSPSYSWVGIDTTPDGSQIFVTDRGGNAIYTFTRVPYELSWYTIDGGGIMWSTAGGFELSGTVGQPDANEIVMTAGGFELAGGFWVETIIEMPCDGDLNGDGKTDQADLGILLADWGCDDPVNGCDGDLNGDDKTNQADLGILLADWGCGT
jgi:hypothetical protein